MAKEKAGERVAYQIRVQGKLDERWSEWFSGLRVVAGNASENPPVTTLIGSVDQAGLRGILNKIWDLNLSLLAVVPVAADELHGEVEDES